MLEANTKSSSVYWKKKAVGSYTLKWRLISESVAEVKYADIMSKQKERKHKINNRQLLLQDYDYKLENDIYCTASPWDELQKFR